MKKVDVREFRRLVRRLSRQTGLLLWNRDCCSGVTVAQSHVLLELQDLGQASLNTLADALGLDKSTVSKAIETLVACGLVERSQDREDRRRVLISLSKSGVRKASEVDETGDANALQIIHEIPLEKRRAVLDCLCLLVDAGDRVNDRCCGKETKT